FFLRLPKIFRAASEAAREVCRRMVRFMRPAGKQECLPHLGFFALLIFFKELADFFGEEAAEALVEVGLVTETDEALDHLLVEPVLSLADLLVLKKAMIDDSFAGETRKLQVDVFDISQVGVEI